MPVGSVGIYRRYWLGCCGLHGGCWWLLCSVGGCMVLHGSCRSPENSREDKKTRTIAGNLEEPCGYLQNLPNMVRNSPVNCCPRPYFHGDYGGLVQILVQTLAARPPVVERGGGGKFCGRHLRIPPHSFYPKLSPSHRT